MSTASIALRPLVGQSLRISSQPRSVPIRNAAGRVVGAVRTFNDRRVLFRCVDERLHRLRHPAAWAQDREVLDQARRAGAEAVVLEDRHAARRWTARLTDFEARGFAVRRGHGDQIGLCLEHWRAEALHGPVQVALFDPAPAGVFV